MLKSKNILKQEQEFIKLNEEIETKTKVLLSEVDHIKEVQSDNDKLYWENFENILRDKNEDCLQNDEGEEKEKENPDDSVELMDGYLSKIKNGESVDLSEQKHVEDSKTKEPQFYSRRNLRLTQSAKISVLSTTTLGQEPILSLELSRLKSGANFKLGETNNDVIPETLKGVGHDGITRFLTAKVKVLTQQLEVLQKDEKEHLEKIKELQAYKDKSMEEQNKLTQQVNMNRSVLVKMEQHADRVEVQLQNAKAENSYLKKEVDSFKRELRESNKKNSANDIRLNRTLEEVEKLKFSLQQKTHEEKELRELYRKKTEELTNAIKKLERQRAELLNGFKKQLLIIDNLKTQKGLIEANKILREAEEDFLNFLDCNQPNRFPGKKA